MNASNITTGTLTGSVLPNTVVLTSGDQTIAGTKTFFSPILVTNTFNVNGSAANQQQDGLYVADLGSTIGTTNNPIFTAAIV